MSEHAAQGAAKAVDSLQQRLTEYACGFNYQSLPPNIVHAAKLRIIDTLGALVGGFFGEPCVIGRDLAAQMPMPDGASIIGTRMKTTPDLAAFVNATTARYVEMNDTYHWPGSYQGHPSDVVLPVLAAAEHAQVDGKALIAAVVLGYEVFIRICDVFHNRAFDNANFSCIASAVAAGKLFGLNAEQLSHCISMAVVPNNILRQVRMGHLSMFKAASAGAGARAGVFAAMLARAGMEGPHLPFEGKAGWFEHIAGGRLTLDTWGGGATPFKIVHTQIKNRACLGVGSSSVLAAEKVARKASVRDVKRITVELYKYARDMIGVGEHHWNPETKETADHSGPYLVAATLMDGTISPRSYDDAHLSNPDLLALIKKIEVVENPEFTRAYQQMPQQHRTRVTIETNSGERLVGESGGDADDLASERTDAQIDDKFRMLAEDTLGSARVKSVLQRLWGLEDMKNAGEIPRALVMV